MKVYIIAANNCGQGPPHLCFSKYAFTSREAAEQDVKRLVDEMERKHIRFEKLMIAGLEVKNDRPAKQ